LHIAHAISGFPGLILTPSSGKGIEYLPKSLIQNVHSRTLFCAVSFDFYTFALSSLRGLVLTSPAMQRNKIDRTKVLAALNTICPACGVSISPAEVVRIDFERMRCPKCGHVFEAGKSPSKG
jgi:predicted RNA-binding Zn-ribbon protein involved in translation (DUF1610 family)